MNQPSLTTTRKWVVLTGGALVFAALLITELSYTYPQLVTMLQWPSDDVLLVTAFFTITFSAGTLLLTLGGLLKDNKSAPPEPETTPRIPQAGSEFDRLISRRLFAQRLAEDERQRIRTRLRHAAIETIQRTAGVSRTRAEELVEHGEWTGDKTAAAFLGQPTAPRSVQLYNYVSSQVAFQHGARQTAQAIVMYVEESDE